MNIKIAWLQILTLLFFVNAYSQHHNTKAANSLKEIFTKGEVEGHVRNYFMSTINQGHLKDYYTNAIGGSIMFKTKIYKGFELGVKGIFTYKGFSSNLNQPDEITGKISKWKHELYDITNFNNFNDLDRLEELYIKYYFKNGYFTYGKLAIEETPLLNESDGRMKPFAFNGFWLNFNIKKTIFNLSWLDKVSPRSTVEWYNFNEAIGLVNNGFQPNGNLAHYHENLNSKGLASLQFETSINEFNLKANHYYLNKISNTSLLEIDYNKKHWLFGLQYAIQFADNNQKKLSYNQRYIQPNENAQVLSLKAAYRNNPKWNLNLAYTKVFKTGRFLFPKELGRDHFFTSIPRSRLEGLGNVNIYTISSNYNFKPKGLNINLAFTKTNGIKFDDFKYNKYNIDNYFQINTKIQYPLHGFFEGVTFDLLYVYKENLNTNLAEQVINQSNYHQINFVTNYVF